MCFSAISLLVVLFLLRGGRGNAWHFWPFSSPSLHIVTALPSTGPSEETPSHVRPCKFQIPFDTSKYRHIIARQDATELNCRYELARRLLADSEGCSLEASLKAFARIATICHYRESSRMHALPPSCHDESCIPQLSPEAFQVYTAFHLHAEKICREINAQMWMESIEDMVGTLTTVGDDAIKQLTRISQENEEFLQRHSRDAEALTERLDTMRQKQLEHLQLEFDHIRVSQQSFSGQQMQMESLRGNLSQLQLAMSGFAQDNIITILMEIKSSQQGLTIMALVQGTAFYIAFPFTLRLLSGIIAPRDPLRIHIRRTFALTLISSLSFDSLFMLASWLFIPSQLRRDVERIQWMETLLRAVLDAIVVDERLLWNVRLAHLMVALMISSILLLSSLFFGLSEYLGPIRAGQRIGRLADGGEDTKLVSVLLGDIIRLKTMKYLPERKHRDKISPELQQLLEDPPPGYRTACFKLDGFPVDHVVYRTDMSKSFDDTSCASATKYEESFFDEQNAFDSPHCISAL